ncbi:MAG: hypothetical protein ALECFALPRED_006750 [Alectoria fallacina]|uniref:DUF7908 domain-containing protein n=1 Tax=Alectoria fallacina TaxID=1903189 RepID=A0A8H3G491_9LECA|nr:MAG: hypothetical protein ALECFALPRED_006750 [Alectoria fallacina]
MITSSVAAFVLAYLRAVQAQATICLATYGGVATSVPPPGRDFIIQVSPYLSPFDPGDSGSGYLDSTGQLQSLCQKSSTFILSSGLLYSGRDRVSVAPGVPIMRFGASEYVEAIDNIFAVDEGEGKMVWNNEMFEDGTARFCADSTGALYGVFLGPLPEDCTATELRVQNPASCSSLPKPILVLPTMLGNHTSLVVPTAIISGPPRQLQPQIQPQLQPQLQPSPVSSLSNLNTSSTASSILYSPSFSLNSSSSALPIPPSSSSNSSTIPSITITSPSLPSSSVTSTGSFIAFTTFTLTSANTTLVSSSSTTPGSNFKGPIERASSIIAQDRLTVWCTEVLGYTIPPQITVTIVSNVSATSVVTTRPIHDTTTNPATLTSTETQRIPSFNITITTTPTVTETVTSTDEVVIVETTTVLGPSLGAKKRGLPYLPGKPDLVDEQQPRLVAASDNTTSAISNTTLASSGTLPASTNVISIKIYANSAGNHTSLVSNYSLPASSSATPFRSNATASVNGTSAITNATGLRTITTPVVLQTFNPSIINAACSQNAVMPTPFPNVTTSITTTFIHTNHIKQPYATLNTTYIIPVNTTISNGNHSITITATPITNDVANVATTTSTITSSIVTFPSNVPTLILTSAVPLGPFNSDGAPPPDIDDAAYELTLPFQMRMFDHSSNIVWVSSNGILSLDNGTREYDNECLPSIGNEDYPNDPVPPYSAFPYWDDTYIYAGQPQGIYYTYGNGLQNNITTQADAPPATNVTFEYYLSHCCGNGDGGNEKYYHYTVFYDSLSPGVFTYRYYQISENGTSATVGIQDFLADTAITYSCNQAIVTPGLEVVLNSIIGTVQQSNFQ